MNFDFILSTALGVIMVPLALFLVWSIGLLIIKLAETVETVPAANRRTITKEN